ncbi:DUF4232 domain-containing protein [Streptomyces sp. NPDC087422]|uniref:DUF4232 domain-containing protein n=1 Tax=Streptomyces sp. NPDC087422 TaxID=3365786 RepID=UPI00381E1D5D
MSSIRNSRTRTRFVTAAATVALAAFALTACDDGSGSRDEGASPASSSSSSDGSPSVTPTLTPGSGSTTADAGGTPVGSKPAADASTKKPVAKAPAPKKPGAKDTAVTCQGSNTKTVASPLNRPVNHMLLTVTNTGGNPCLLYTYPSVQFTDAQAEPPVIEESQPQAVVTLNPGESGYAVIVLAAADGSAEHGRTVKTLNVYFHGRSGNESVGTGAHPSLPAGGTYIDDSLKVSYWQQSMNDAISW